MDQKKYDDFLRKAHRARTECANAVAVSTSSLISDAERVKLIQEAREASAQCTAALDAAYRLLPKPPIVEDEPEEGDF